MVTVTAQDKTSIAEALKRTHGSSSAELTMVIARASDHYSSFVILYGLLLGSAAAIAAAALHYSGNMLSLMVVQLGVMGLVMGLCWFWRGYLALIPASIRTHHAQRRAGEEYLKASHRMGAGHKLVFFYVSLGERYAHVFANPAVREVIDDTRWDAVMAEFIRQMQAGGLKDASVKTIERIAALLAQSFPPGEESPAQSDELIEMKD